MVYRGVVLTARICGTCRYFVSKDYCSRYRRKTHPQWHCRWLKKEDSAGDLEIVPSDDVIRYVGLAVQCICSYAPRWVNINRIRVDTGYTGNTGILSEMLNKEEGLEHRIIGRTTVWRIRKM